VVKTEEPIVCVSEEREDGEHGDGEGAGSQVTIMNSSSPVHIYTFQQHRRLWFSTFGDLL